MQEQYKIYLVYIIVSLLCIFLIIYVSKVSTGSQIADWIVGISSGIGFMGMSIIIYRWEKTKKELRKMAKETRKELNEMKSNLVEIKAQDARYTPTMPPDDRTVKVVYGKDLDQKISEFILSLHNMQNLKNSEYLEQYRKYKEELKKDLENLDPTDNSIKNNIFIQTIYKYNETDENRNNINELYEHFINIYKNYVDDNYQNDNNLIANLKKLKEVLSINNNASYKNLFDYLISVTFYNDLNLNGNGTWLKKYVWELIFSDIIREKKYGKGESDGKIMQDFINTHNMINANPVFDTFRKNVNDKEIYNN
jgi:hypothetical protein